MWYSKVYLGYCQSIIYLLYYTSDFIHQNTYTCNKAMLYRYVSMNTALLITLGIVRKRSIENAFDVIVGA